MLRTSGAGDLMREALGLGTKAFKENTALTKEAEQRYKTFESRLQIFKNKVNDLAITVGTALLPHLSRLIDRGESVTDWLERANPTTRKLIIGFVIFAAAVGPVTYLIGVFASGVGRLLKVMILLKKAMIAAKGSTIMLRVQLALLWVQTKLAAFWTNFLAGGMLKLRIQMALLAVQTKLMAAAQWLLNIALTANPIGVIVMAVAALAAAFIYAYLKITWFRNFINKFWPVLIGLMLGPLAFLVAMVIKHFDSIVGFVKSMPGRISGAARGMFNGIKNAFRGAINWIIDKWNGLEFKLPSADLGPLGKVGGFTLGTPDIPRLGTGGYISGPGSWIAGETGVPELSSLLPDGRVKVQPLGGGAAASAAGGGRVVHEHRFFLDSREVTAGVGHQVRVKAATA
jgi:hypothetical protein